MSPGIGKRLALEFTIKLLALVPKSSFSTLLLAERGDRLGLLEPAEPTLPLGYDSKSYCFLFVIGLVTDLMGCCLLDEGYFFDSA